MKQLEGAWEEEGRVTNSRGAGRQVDRWAKIGNEAQKLGTQMGGNFPSGKAVAAFGREGRRSTISVSSTF